MQAPLDELVALVQAGNRLPPLGGAPSAMSLAEARTLVRSASPPTRSKQDPSGELKPSKQRILHVLMTSVSRALAETEADSTAPSYGLYEVWGVSQITLDEPVRNDDVQWLIPVLESLNRSRPHREPGERVLRPSGARDLGSECRSSCTASSGRKRRK